MPDSKEQTSKIVTVCFTVKCTVQISTHNTAQSFGQLG